MKNQFRERRNEMGTEISEIAKTTRIKETFLKAIENEEFEKLPIEVYTKGYIREYAKFLEIPPDDVIIAYERYLYEKKNIKKEDSPEKLTNEKQKEITLPTNNEKAEKIREPEKISAPITPDEEVKKEKSPSLIRRPSFILAAASAVITIGALFFLVPQKKKAPSFPTASPPVVQQQIQNQDKQQTTEPMQDYLAAVTTPAATALEKTKESAVAIQKKKHNLDIAATDKVWIQLTIDGSDKKEMLLNPGDKVNYAADKSLQLLIGNAAGIRLKFNGKDIDVPGNKGQVVKLNLPENQASSSNP